VSVPRRLGGSGVVREAWIAESVGKYGRHICIIASGRTADVFVPRDLEFWPDARHVGGTDHLHPA